MAERGGNGSPVGHAAHDPEPIVALLDRDLAPADRAVGETMVEACAECSALFDDLRALAAASAALPVATRPREFTLTTRDAALLRGDALREPLSAPARLSREMTETSPKHAIHDRLLIAALADRTVDAAERARAEAQVAACDACARLHADLVALSLATREMPVPSRPRDFTLSAEDAERLRIRGWRRILGVFGSAGDVFSRPLAIGLTTLGLAGLLLGTIPSALTGLGGGPAALSTVGAPADVRNSGGAGAEAAPEFMAQASAAASAAPEIPMDTAASAAPAPAAAPSEAPAAAGALESEDPDVIFEGGEQNQMEGEPEQADQFSRMPDPSTGPSPMILVGGALLLAGLALFVLRWAGRRAGAG